MKHLKLLQMITWDILFQFQYSCHLRLQSFYGTIGLYLVLTILKEIKSQWKSNESYKLTSPPKINLWFVVISSLGLQNIHPHFWWKQLDFLFRKFSLHLSVIVIWLRNILNFMATVIVQE